MHMWTDITEIILASLILAGTLYALFSFICVWGFFRKQQKVGSGPEYHYPPVSILKPMKGVDPEWRSNIANFLAQDYPEYEILVGFNDPKDSGIALATDIALSHASKMRVIVHTSRLGSNPKVSNLHGLIKEARFPLLLISDSDIRVDSEYLKLIVEEYLQNREVGVVTCLSKVSHASTLGAGLELLTTAADFIPSVLAARQLQGIRFGLGPSMLLSKQQLDELGGLPAFADYLAEDYQIGNCLWKKGYKNVLSKHLVEYVVGAMSIRNYFIHQVRWARTYKACSPAGFLGYGVTHILPFSFLFASLHGLNTLSLAIIGMALALRYGILALVSKSAAFRTSWRIWLWLLPLKDFFSFGIWVWCFMGSHIYWRGNNYRLLRGGFMKKIS